ncbi:tetratricopeptide repeat protein [Chryseomicrobium palamuruense]|uniref:Tetratricopeptide repeat protein n=1 Tax=Chryseomicrobium palamuruense TaxID=682973 RepID=A0ABV8UV17_9BACL
MKRNDILRQIETGDTTWQENLEAYILSAEPDELYQTSEDIAAYGFVEEALEILKHLSYLFPEEEQLKVDQAVWMLEVGREEEGAELLQSVPEVSDAYPQALLTMADYYQMTGLYEVAEQKLEQAIRLYPEEPILQLAKAELKLETGRYLEAARIFENLWTLRSELPHVDLARRLAETYSAGAAFEEAIPYYKEALLQGEAPDLLFQYGYALFQTEQYQAAIQQLDEVIAIDPDYFSAYLLSSQAYAMLEENEKALERIEQGIEKDSFEKEYYLVAAKLALKLGLEKKAESYFHEAIALDPEYIDAIIHLAQLYLHQEDYEAIIQLTEDVQKDGSTLTSLYPYLAESHEQLENYKQAHEFYELAYTEQKEDVYFLKKYAYFLLEEGKREKAKAIVRELQQLEPESMEWVALLEDL